MDNQDLKHIQSELDEHISQLSEVLYEVSANKKIVATFTAKPSNNDNYTIIPKIFVRKNTFQTVPLSQFISKQVFSDFLINTIEHVIKIRWLAGVLSGEDFAIMTATIDKGAFNVQFEY